jgi:hypothetical protein
MFAAADVLAKAKRITVVGDRGDIYEEFARRPAVCTDHASPNRRIEDRAAALFEFAETLSDSAFRSDDPSGARTRRTQGQRALSRCGAQA